MGTATSVMSISAPGRSARECHRAFFRALHSSSLFSPVKRQEEVSARRSKDQGEVGMKTFGKGEDSSVVGSGEAAHGLLLLVDLDRAAIVQK